MHGDISVEYSRNKSNLKHKFNHLPVRTIMAWWTFSGVGGSFFTVMAQRTLHTFPLLFERIVRANRTTERIAGPLRTVFSNRTRSMVRCGGSWVRDRGSLSTVEAAFTLTSWVNETRGTTEVA